MLTAHQLEQSLRAFAHPGNSGREKDFPQLWLKLNEVDKEVITDCNFMGEDQQLLANAILHAQDTRFLLLNGHEIRPYNDAFTIVALDLHCSFRAALSNPTGFAHEHEGDLFKFALRKAVARLQLLHKSYRLQGLDNDDSYRYISSLLQDNYQTEDEHVYLGEALTAPNVRSRERWVLGASGCELTDEYRASLAPRMLNDQAQYYYAGYADQVFASRVAHFYTTPHSEETTIEEPHFFALSRRAH